MAVLFFWGLALAGLNAYVIFKYQTVLAETFVQKLLYLFGGYIGFPYNLCFPWMVWFMPNDIKPALIGMYILVNFCAVARMIHVDDKKLKLTAWEGQSSPINYARRILLEKVSTLLFLAISALLFHSTGVLYG